MELPFLADGGAAAIAGARLGSGFDIVSGGELARVLAAGGDSQTLGYAALAGYISYPFALFVGLPAFLFMRRKRWDGVRAYALAGLALGLTFLALFVGLAG